jgi:peroxiredoxin
MSKTEPTKRKPITFEVEIESAGRAYREAEAPREGAVVLSPTRAAAKARKRNRYIALGVAVTLLLAVAVAWAWITNPLANVPSDAVARVNGQFIYERDVENRLNFLKFLDALYDRTSPNPPNATSALEEIIGQLMELQDARKAGMAVTESDVDQAVEEIVSSSGRNLSDIEDLLGRYTLKMSHMREYSANLLLIGKNRQRVSAEASDATAEQTLLNEWFQRLIDATKIERFKAPGSGPAPRVGAEAPDFTLQDLSGNDVRLSSLRGKPVMINFWATWCPPCREEIPVITKLYNETEGGSSYEVLGVATQSDTSTIRAFADEFDMDFPLLPDAGSNVVSTYHVLPIPTTFFVDKDGIIRFIQTGPVTRASMEEWLLGE